MLKVMITERPAYWVDGRPFRTKAEAEDYEKNKERMDSFLQTTNHKDPRIAGQLYSQFLSTSGERKNFRSWLDKLDQIGESSKLDLV